MSTYKEIGEAFGRYCEVAWRLRGDARSITQHLITRIAAKGQIPEGFLTFCPPTGERPKFDHPYKIDDALKHDSSADRLLVGFLLKVRRGEDYWPMEYLRFDIMISFGETQYEVQLRDSRVKAEFAPEESPDTHRALDEFAQKVIDEIFSFYDKHPERLKNGGVSTITGFAQIKK